MTLFDPLTISAITGFFETYFVSTLGVAMPNIEAIYREEKYFHDEIIQTLYTQHNMTTPEQQETFEITSLMINEKMAQKMVILHTITRAFSGPIKCTVSYLIDRYGVWYARFFNIFFCFLALCVALYVNIAAENILSPYIIYFGFPAFFAFNIGIYFLSVLLGNMYTVNHLATYFMIQRLTFIIEPKIYSLFKGGSWIV